MGNFLRPEVFGWFKQRKKVSEVEGQLLLGGRTKRISKY